MLNSLFFWECGKQTGYDAGYIKLVSHKLWHLLTETFSEKVSKSTVQSIIRRQMLSKRADVTQTIPNLSSRPSSNQDWGEVVDVTFFYGRGSEISTLEKWIDHDCCRLVAIL